MSAGAAHRELFRKSPDYRHQILLRKIRIDAAVPLLPVVSAAEWMPADGEADIKRLCGLSGNRKVTLQPGVPGFQSLDIRDAAILKLDRREFRIGRVAVQDPASVQVDLLLREEPADEAAAFGFGPEVNRDAADIKLGTGETGYRQIGAFDREIDEDWCKPGDGRPVEIAFRFRHPESPGRGVRTDFDVFQCEFRPVGVPGGGNFADPDIRFQCL